MRSRLLNILKPARYGGYELDLLTFVRVAVEIARGDASAGWIYAILGIHNWWGGYAHPQLQEELWGDQKERLFADVFAPVGTARPAGNGYWLSGHWKFASGVPWSDFVAVGAMAPAPDSDAPEYMMFFVPRSDYRIEDEWHVVGLRGTASNSVVIEGVFVPHHRVFRLGQLLATGKAPGQDVNPGPLYRLPFIPALCAALVAPVVGAARAAIEEFQRYVKDRVPLFRDRPQKETASAQILLAEVSARMDAVETLLYRYAQEVMAYAERLLSDSDRARFFAWRAYMVRQAVKAVDQVFDAAGGHAIFRTHPLQRIWRDVHTAAQHVALNYASAMEAYGRTLVGLPSESFL